MRRAMHVVPTGMSTVMPTGVLMGTRRTRMLRIAADFARRDVLRGAHRDVLCDVNGNAEGVFFVDFKDFWGLISP